MGMMRDLAPLSLPSDMLRGPSVSALVSDTHGRAAYSTL